VTRKPFDLDAYLARVRAGCFICEFVRGNPDYAHHLIHEDDHTVIFLNKYPTLGGDTLVCPKAHQEDLTLLSREDYLRLQTVVHRISIALKRVLAAERVYVLSLGSNQGNSHLHWHVAPLPSGIPYEQQQFFSLMQENGVLDLSEETMRELAQTIGRAFRETD
jgi:diadenosine tetraphosphate (Ap4A) HIT family hydrolase